MFDLFNKPVLEEAISSGQTLRFSHDPREYRVGAFAQEWELIKIKLGVSDIDLFFDGGFWYVKQ